MWLGVVGAIVICSGVAYALHVAEENLPQREQEQLETVIALAAVGMITWMVVWMRRHSADLKGDLQQRGLARPDPGIGVRPRRHGVPGGPPRGPRDRGLHARRVPAVGPPGSHRHRRAARRRARGGARLPDLPGRSEDQPLEVLPHHRRGARARRRRALVLRGAHRARGRVVEPPARSRRRPPVDHRPRFGAVGADHRDVRHPTRADPGRAHRIPRVRGPDDDLRLPAARVRRRAAPTSHHRSLRPSKPSDQPIPRRDPHDVPNHWSCRGRGVGGERHAHGRPRRVPRRPRPPR